MAFRLGVQPSKSVCEETFGCQLHFVLQVLFAGSQQLTALVRCWVRPTVRRQGVPNVEALLHSSVEAGCTDGIPSYGLGCRESQERPRLSPEKSLLMPRLFFGKLCLVHRR
jgi:hypothetical protein